MEQAMTAPKQWPSRTRDGRELFTAVFRPIPGFGLYEVTVDGDVRNRNTGRLLQETENTRTGAWHYTLRRDGGTKTSRSYQSLVRDAWGDTDVTRGAGAAHGAEVAPVDHETKQGPQKGAEQ